MWRGVEGLATQLGGCAQGHRAPALAATPRPQKAPAPAHRPPSLPFSGPLQGFIDGIGPLASMPRFLSVLGVTVLRSVPLRQMANQVQGLGLPGASLRLTCPSWPLAVPWEWQNAGRRCRLHMHARPFACLHPPMVGPPPLLRRRWPTTTRLGMQLTMPCASAGCTPTCRGGPTPTCSSCAAAGERAASRPSCWLMGGHGLAACPGWEGRAAAALDSLQVGARLQQSAALRSKAARLQPAAAAGTP